MYSLNGIVGWRVASWFLSNLAQHSLLQHSQTTLSQRMRTREKCLSGVALIIFHNYYICLISNKLFQHCIYHIKEMGVHKRLCSKKLLVLHYSRTRCLNNFHYTQLWYSVRIHQVSWTLLYRIHIYREPQCRCNCLSWCRCLAVIFCLNGNIS